MEFRWQIIEKFKSFNSIIGKINKLKSTHREQKRFRYWRQHEKEIKIAPLRKYTTIHHISTPICTHKRRYNLKILQIRIHTDTASKIP